ncbi:MAG: hypothetical protein NZM15_03840 [Flavobacteriales bacterium]|nr:hypothetical protein [Flavobacteriales bacterium]MDW8431817.1 hypothetical protein [Flavobacteriales bacterium]
MRIHFILLHFLFFSPASLLACGPCGCSGGTPYLGILPQFRSHFVGIRYNFQSIRFNHSGLKERLQFHSTEVWGRFYVHPRIQMLMQVPFQAIQTRTGTGPHQWINQGMGDLRLMLNGLVLQTPDTSQKTWRHALLLGAGLKAPTGTYNAVREGQVLAPSLQLGSGSWDWISSAMYTVRHSRLGLNVSWLTLWRQPNPLRYKLSDQHQVAASLFGWLKRKSLDILPQGGVLWEHLTSEKSQGIPVSLTGGNTGLLTAGCDLYWKRLFISAVGMWPLVHQIQGGTLKPGMRVWTSLTFLF